MILGYYRNLCKHKLALMIYTYDRKMSVEQEEIKKNAISKHEKALKNDCTKITTNIEKFKC